MAKQVDLELKKVWIKWQYYFRTITKDLLF